MSNISIQDGCDALSVGGYRSRIILFYGYSNGFIIGIGGQNWQETMCGMAWTERRK